MNTNKNQIKTVKLGEVAEFVNGYPFKPTDWHPDEQGLPIIRIQNLNNETKPFNYFLGKVPGKYYVDDGALLFSWSGTPGTSFGAFFWNRGPAVVNQHIFRVIWGDKVDPNYFRYAMNSTLDHIISQAHGGVGLKHITKGKLLDVEIPLPPLPEQKRIAEILDLADEARRKRRENLTLYDDLIRSLFLQTFGDPVSNPNNLKTTTLEKVCVRVTDGTHQSPTWEPSGVPFLFISNIVDGQIRFNTSKYISEKTHEELTRRCSIEVGDVLYTTVGSYGNVAVVSATRKFAFQRHIAHIKPDHGSVNSTFLAAMLQSPGVRRQVDKAARGVAQKTVNLADLKRLVIFDPPLSVQKELANQIEEINLQKAREQALYDQHDDLFNSLLQRAFCAYPRF